ncbi:chemotaxis protein CheA [Tranquillimonas alkanivorans]|uniref:Chemotaxis protein CheA n=1 Tax=Tranquillimonas alkanivorans TaxID=441119 RepID=A0A1I5M4J7_9RHOB|nr:chemotaxis protein CheA [Tranquillimonas alkanivorans]SFP04430.1 two-component system, chemotaxis family, sensor kinase CheA [Tranquillimonas alkanivorans]
MDAETLAVFREEADALVESLQDGLLALHDAPGDTALIDRVFRDLHTIKGTGAMFGHTALAAFVHDFETAFEKIRSGETAVTPDLVNLSLRAYDCIVRLLAGEGRDEAEERSVLADLARHMEGAEPPAEGWRVTFRLPPDTLALGGKPELLLEELSALGQARVQVLADRLPDLGTLEADRLHLGWQIEIEGAPDEQAVRDVFLFHEDDMELEIAPLHPDAAPAERDAPAPPDAKAPAAAAPPKTGAAPAMRVSAERLDEMMDRVGELVIAEARLAELAAASSDPALISVAEDIQRLAMGMRDTTMSIRMTPIGSITGRFRRLVHDLSETLGKPINFSVTGEETELDKTVIEQLTDPLMHLIRNAADHGLEGTPEARAEFGKPPAGRIDLSARYSGAEVLISLSDDGRGLDEDRIRARAIDRGLIAPDADLQRPQVLSLILEPGFSTAATVTELSGRGVGMDVVKRTIETLRGSIDVSSEPGHGTSVTLRLPLTLAIIDGLLVDVGGERYTLPLAAVEEIVELPPDKRHSNGSTQFLDIRDRLVPFLRLRDLFSTTGEPDPFQKVVVVSAGSSRIGLVVDRIIGSNQTVIKQLSPLHARLTTFSGATILGDGTVALILDVPHLVEHGPTAPVLESAA